ncbi:YHYH protein [Psychroserpens algicola]|uniref:YHYH protein n=1 Tax=Psychroserpens algicola TaxID=1719034 RepID=UPI001F2357F4|nr:YHYH protein [Psychroserpens algicola]
MKHLVAIVAISLIISSCKSNQKTDNQTTQNTDNKELAIKIKPVNTDYFITENIIGEISEEKVDLRGIETLCYVIKTNSQASEHQMGPWCPRHIDDGIEKAGIWFDNGKVYDVSGHFIANLDEFYDDDKWKLYKDDGSIKVTDTEEACLSAAKPNVDEDYHNYCVECLPEYFKNQITTYYIPVTPTYQNSSQRFGRGGIGLAFNGVKFDPPAPTHAILAAHTIAPLDDHGGHVNPHGGYHYHAVTGSTKEITQSDTHAPMIGYAIDGFGIYALLDKNGTQPSDLDECGGHSDNERGYHYHAGAPGDNQIIKCLHGTPGRIDLQE